MARSVSATGQGSPGALAEGSYCDVGAFLSRGSNSTSIGHPGSIGPPGFGVALGSPGPGGAASSHKSGAVAGVPALATPVSGAVYGPAALMHQASFGHRQPMTPGGAVQAFQGQGVSPPKPHASHALPWKSRCSVEPDEGNLSLIHI